MSSLFPLSSLTPQQKWMQLKLSLWACRSPPVERVNASEPNLCDQLRKSGQANTPASAVAKRLASCSTPLSHTLPGLIGFICIMYMGRVHHIIMQVIDERSVEWTWKVTQDTPIHLHTIRRTLSDKQFGKRSQKELESLPVWVRCRSLRKETLISFSVQHNPAFCRLASSQCLTSRVT